MSPGLTPTTMDAFDRPWHALSSTTDFASGAVAEPHAGLFYTVILASGTEDGGKRATLALSMACTALSMELNTHLFLVGDGSYWAYQGHAAGVHVAGFPALDELLESFVDLGGHLAVCSTCNQVLCHAPDSRDKVLRRRPGVQVQGMATLTEHLVRGRAVTF